MVVTESDGTGDEPQWERVLWRPQPFPDNYVPPTFLAALSKNRKQRFKFSYLKVTESCLFCAANVLPYQYWPLVLGACTICQHLSVIFVFLAVFTRLLDQTLDPRLLVVVSSASFVVGCIVWEFMEYFGSDAAWNTFSDHRTFFKAFTVALIQSICGLGARAVKASLLIFLALIALAPILRTLTAPTSADSISALTTALFLVHAALADYSYAASPVQRERLTSVLSINAAISAAVVLASRLHNDLAVFALMLFSVEAFALFPILRRRIQVRTVLTAVMSSSSTHLLNAVDGNSCSVRCYAIAGVGGISGTLAQTLCGRDGQRDIWITCGLDVGPAAQIVSISFSSLWQRIIKYVLIARFADHGTPRRRVGLNGERVAKPFCASNVAIEYSHFLVNCVVLGSKLFPPLPGGQRSASVKVQKPKTTRSSFLPSWLP